jgi:hypothetical protein
MKRDITFIKHIKPQLKEKEKTDKANHREAEYSRACKCLGIDPNPALQIEDMGLLASIFKAIKKEKKE